MTRLTWSYGDNANVQVVCLCRAFPWFQDSKGVFNRTGVIVKWWEEFGFFTGWIRQKEQWDGWGWIWTAWFGGEWCYLVALKAARCREAVLTHLGSHFFGMWHAGYAVVQFCVVVPCCPTHSWCSGSGVTSSGKDCHRHAGRVVYPFLSHDSMCILIEGQQFN